MEKEKINSEKVADKFVKQELKQNKNSWDEVIDKINDAFEKAKKYDEKETVRSYTKDIYADGKVAQSFTVCGRCGDVIKNDINHCYCPRCGQKVKPFEWIKANPNNVGKAMHNYKFDMSFLCVNPFIAANLLAPSGFRISVEKPKGPKPKFEVGDEVYCITMINTIDKRTIKKVVIRKNVDTGENTYEYCFKDYTSKKESEVFKNFEEAQKALIKKVTEESNKVR